jgi:hypothetical protein
MTDLYNEAAVATFPVAINVLIISYLALVLVHTEIRDVVSFMHVVKFASVRVTLLLVIKLTHNNLTPYIFYFF